MVMLSLALKNWLLNLLVFRTISPECDLECDLDPQQMLNQYRRDQNIHNSSRRNAFVAV